MTLRPFDQGNKIISERRFNYFFSVHASCYIHTLLFLFVSCSPYASCLFFTHCVLFFMPHLIPPLFLYHHIPMYTFIFCKGYLQINCLPVHFVLFFVLTDGMFFLFDGVLSVFLVFLFSHNNTEECIWSMFLFFSLMRM